MPPRVARADASDNCDDTDVFGVTRVGREYREDTPSAALFVSKLTFSVEDDVRFFVFIDVMWRTRG